MRCSYEMPSCCNRYNTTVVTMTCVNVLFQLASDSTDMWQSHLSTSHTLLQWPAKPKPGKSRRLLVPKIVTHPRDRLENANQSYVTLQSRSVPEGRARRHPPVVRWVDQEHPIVSPNRARVTTLVNPSSTDSWW